MLYIIRTFSCVSVLLRPSGLSPILQIEGVHLILGNKLAGDCVWPNVPSSPMVLTEGDVIQIVTKGDTVAVATRSMTKYTECVLTDEAKKAPKAVSLSIPDLSDLSFPFSKDEWSREKHSDSSFRLIIYSCFF